MDNFSEFIVHNGLIDKTYPNYLVRASKNGLQKNERNFLNYVLTNNSDELKQIKKIDTKRLSEIFQYLSDHHFAVKYFLNESIYQYFENKFENLEAEEFFSVEDFRKLLFLDSGNNRYQLNTENIYIFLNKMINQYSSLKFSFPKNNIFKAVKLYITGYQYQIIDINQPDIALLLLPFGADFHSNRNVMEIIRGVDYFLTSLKSVNNENRNNIKKEIYELLEKSFLNRGMSKSFTNFPIFNNNLGQEETAFISFIINNNMYQFNVSTWKDILSFIEKKNLTQSRNIFDKLETLKAQQIVLNSIELILAFFQDEKNSNMITSSFPITSNYNNFKKIYNYNKNSYYIEELLDFVGQNVLWQIISDFDTFRDKKYYTKIIEKISKSYLTKQIDKLDLESFVKIVKRTGNSIINKIDTSSMSNTKIKDKVNDLINKKSIN